MKILITEVYLNADGHLSVHWSSPDKTQSGLWFPNLGRTLEATVREVLKTRGLAVPIEVQEFSFSPNLYLVRSFSDHDSEPVLGLYSSVQEAQGMAKAHAPYSQEDGEGFSGAEVLECRPGQPVSEWKEIEVRYCSSSSRIN